MDGTASHARVARSAQVIWIRQRVTQESLAAPRSSGIRRRVTQAEVWLRGRGCARGGSRTRTPFGAAAFKAAVSAVPPPGPSAADHRSGWCPPGTTPDGHKSSLGPVSGVLRWLWHRGGDFGQRAPAPTRRSSLLPVSGGVTSSNSSRGSWSWPREMTSRLRTEARPQSASTRTLRLNEGMRLTW